MPVTLAPLVAIALGAVLALASGWDRRPDAPGAAARPELFVALFAALVFAPVQGYFVAFAPDWSTSYLVDGRAVPSAVSLLVVLLSSALVVAGFALARPFGRWSRGVPPPGALGRGLTVAGIPAALAMTLAVALLPRLRVEGTYHQFRGDFGVQPVAGGPLGWALLWMDSLLVAGVVVTLRGLREAARGRRPDRAPPADAIPPHDSEPPATGEPPRLLGRAGRVRSSG